MAKYYRKFFYTIMPVFLLSGCANAAMQTDNEDSFNNPNGIYQNSETDNDKSLDIIAPSEEITDESEALDNSSTSSDKSDETVSSSVNILPKNGVQRDAHEPYNMSDEVKADVSVSESELYTLSGDEIVYQIPRLTFYNAEKNRSLQDIVVDNAVYDALLVVDATQYYIYKPEITQGLQYAAAAKQAVDNEMTAVFIEGVSKAIEADREFAQDTEMLQAINHTKSHPFDEQTITVIDLIKTKYYDAYKKIRSTADEAYGFASNERNMSSEWVEQVVQNRTDYYIEQDFLKNISVYDKNGKYFGTFDASSAEDLKLLADYINTAREAAIEDIRLDEHKNIMISELEENVIYRISAIIRNEKVSFNLCNDLDNDIIYTVKSPSGTVSEYHCARSLDRPTTLLTTLKDVDSAEISYRKLPADESILDYIPSSDVLCLSEIPADQQITYPSNKHYIYNDTGSNILLSAIKNDRDMINPSVYTMELPKNAATTLSPERADVVMFSLQ